MNVQLFTFSPKKGLFKPNLKKYLLLLLIVGLSVRVATAQTFNFSFKHIALDKAINQIAKATGYQFIFDADYVRNAKPINLEITSATITEALDLILKQQNFSYQIEGKVIVLTPKITQKVPQENPYLIKGKVKDSSGLNLPNVMIRVRDTQTTTQTDNAGNFSIQVTDKNHTLVLTYLGYKGREVVLPRSNSTGIVTIVLVENPSLLSEVLINGYQTISKERSTAAFTLVDSAKLNRQINVDLLSALEGRVAGLVYNKNPNGIGADKPVLRGIGTFSNNVGTSPLIVIDGLPTETALEDINPYDIESVTVLKDAAAASIYGSRSANGVIVITTKKGIGNGVKVSANADMFITGKPDISKMHYASTSDLIDFETDVYNNELANYSSTQSMFDYYGDVNKGTIHYYSPLYQLYRRQSEGTLTQDEVNGTLRRLRQNDYIKDYTQNVWQNEIRQRYNVALSSNSAKSNNYLSLDYDNTKPRMKYNLSENFNLYAKTSFDLKKWLHVNIGINGNYGNNKVSDGSYNNYMLQPRYAQITDAAGNLVQSDYANLSDGFTSSGDINPAVLKSLEGNPDFKPYNFNILDAIQDGMSRIKSLNLRTFADLKINLYKGISYSSQFQYETRRQDLEQYNDADGYKMRYAYNALTGLDDGTNKFVHNLPSGGRYYQLSQQSNNYTFRNQFSYDGFFGKKGNEHSIAAIAGVEMRQNYFPRSNESLRYGYDPVTLNSVILDNATLSRSGVPSYIYGSRTLGVIAGNQREIRHRYLSFYSNASYTFRNRYNLTGSVRIDQADLFGADPKYKNRPLWSVGAGWNASNEDFLNDVSWLSLLKVRATYGINGNVDQTSSPYLTARYRNDRLFPDLQYTDIVALPNPKLRWEKTATTNFGVDYAFFQNRLRGSLDFYNRYSSDLLVTTDLDPTVGATSRVLNNGALRNRGVEISVGGDWLKHNDLMFSSSIVFAYNKNKVEKVNNGTTSAFSYIQSPSNYFFINTQYNSLYAYKYGGMRNGYPYFLDENGQSNVTFDDSGVPTSVKDINSPDALVNKGVIDPVYNGSFNQRISYKSFELSALFVFSGGNKLRKDVTSLASNAVTDQDITQRWKAGSTSDLPRLYLDYPLAIANYASTLSDLWQYSDKQILSATYVKLRNVALSYSLPSSLNKIINVSSVKLTAQVNNLWYWSAAGDDIDPETFSSNSGTRSLPLPKSFIFGLNVNF